MTEKEAVLKAVSELPEDVTYAEAIEHLYILKKLARRMKDDPENRKMASQEARRIYSL